MAMGLGAGMAISAGAGILSKGMGMLGNRDKAKDQLDQQRELTEIQKRANEELMKKSFGLQKGMYDYTYNKESPTAMVEQYRKAGMNPALAYSQGLAGGTMGSGGATVGGGTASNETDRMNAETNKEGMALQNAMLQSQVRLNESVAKKNEVETEKTGAETKTIEEQRSLLTANLKEVNQGMFIENMRKQWNDDEQEDYQRHSKLNETTGQWHTIDSKSNYNMEVTTAIIKTQAEIGNVNAQELLTNKKAQGYYQELLNATAMADNDKIKTAAVKLASEWTTGEFVNWKTWADMAKNATAMVGDIAKMAM